MPDALACASSCRTTRGGRGSDSHTLVQVALPFGLVSWIADSARQIHQNRRRVRVLVHKAFFVGSPVPYLFVNVTNLSPARDIEITHVWFDAQPQISVTQDERRLPARLRPDESWETWIEAAALASQTSPERLARVRLSTGKVIKGRLNRDVPPEGYVPGRREQQ